MKYLVTVGGKDFEVSITEDGVALNGSPMEAALTPVPDSPLYQLRSGRGARTYAMRRGVREWAVERRGESWTVRVADERTRQLERFRDHRATRDAPAAVRAPMPGLVLRVEVEVGQPVAPGAGLVVLEAMKMENEIRSPTGGTVKAVLVEAGQAVEKGAPLVEIHNPQ